jgi:PAS domain S-box-containing protein
MYEDMTSNELKFRSLFQNANEGIAILQEGVFTEVNAKLLEYFDCTQEYFLGYSLVDISPKNQPDGKSSKEKLEEYLTDVLKGKPTLFDWQHINKKGDILHFEISLGFINNGENSFILALWRDITERIEMLEKVKEAKEKADNASMLKSRFLANMSHEIRTPMNGILGFLDILAKDEKDSRRKELFGHIKNSSNTLLAIINDILDISKIESGKLLIESVAFPSKELFEDVATLYENICTSHDINFIYDNSTTLPAKIVGDKVRIKQVLTNFLSNAVKFTDKGGEITFSVVYDKELKLLECAVKDNGRGIHSENLKKIFNDFEQEDVSTTRKYGGTGLGLSISSKLISLMHGSIDVESEYGRGSLFHFSIPLECEVLSTEDSVVEDEQSLDTFHAHVLIVEDNKTNQLLLSMLLEDFGVTYEIANDGVEGVNIASKKKFDIIFMDENMPNMNGIEATKKIRVDVVNKSTPIVAVTANALSGDKERFIEAGMNEYISKPYDDGDIQMVLQKYLT